LTILTELENIDDDVDRQKIAMVKTTDEEFAAEVGVETFPSLVFFKVTFNKFNKVFFYVKGKRKF
jgi:hypothetical protein